ncbi:MAG: hypothetical protein RBG13Loki_0659 [Promethearchaeota archaeon CR_4]|nr:MAG: hypothetical protein RBG13Loki_0659 [Candidatus Lokiarchaeota archaeon CR_4]
MSRPPNVKVTRPVPTYRALVKLYNKEEDADKVRHLHAIILMKKMRNAEAVAKMCGVSANTVRRWVEAFNAGGLEGLFKKKAPEDPQA